MNPQKVHIGLLVLFATHWFILFLPISGQEKSGWPSSPKEVGVPHIRNIHPKEYKQHSQNWSIIQDDRGILYFGNGQGVLEYDGVTWRIIENAKSTRVRSLAKDKYGVIYVGASGDFGYLSPDSIGQMKFVSLLDHVNSDDRDFTEVWRTHATPNGIYFQAYDKLFRWANQKIKIWKPSIPFYLSYVVQDTLYVAQRQNRLLKMVGDSLHVVSTNRPAGLNEMLLFDDKRILLCGSYGLFWMTGKRITPFTTSNDAFIQENIISSAALLPNGQIALGTYRGGLAIVNKYGNVEQILNNSSGLQNDDIKDLYVDSQGNLWLALQFGITQLRTPSTFTYFTESEGIKGLTDVLIRHQGMLYAGTSQGLYYLQADSARTAPMFKSVKGIDREVFSLLSVNNILMAGTNGGAYSVAKDHSLLSMTKGETVFSLHRSEQDSNTIYLGLDTGLGIIRYDEKGWRYGDRLADIDQSVLNIVEQTDGTLWMATNEAILRVEIATLDNKSVVKSIQKFGKGLVLLTPKIAILGDRVYFPTNNGLKYFDETQEVLQPASTFGIGLADTTRSISRIFRIHSGQVLFHTIKDEISGYWLVKPLKPDSYSLDKNRFHAIQFFGTIYSSFTDQDAVTWFGCNTGIIRYNPAAPTAILSDHSALIRRVSIINSDSVIYGGMHSSQFQTSGLPYQNNSLHFEYALPDFQEVNENLFQYRLDGFDTHWSGWTRETKKDYTNLSEGEYIFRIRAKNAHDRFGEEAQFAFQILPPWYRAWWAYLFYFTAGFGFILLIVKSRVRHLEKKTAELEAIVADRTATISEQAEKLKELDRMKSRFFANISHEFRTPLTLILGPLEKRLAKTRSRSDKEELGLMHRNARRLLGLINQLLDLSRLESGRLKLEASPGDLLTFLKGIVMSFASLAEQRQITLDYNSDDALRGLHEIYFDPDKIEKIFYNLLSNAFKFTGDKGMVSVSVKRAGDNNDYIVVAVSDNGVGISREQLQNIFDRFYQADSGSTREQEGTGIGLALTKELVELHHGSIEVHSKPGQGTNFIVKLPAQKSLFEKGELVEKIVEKPKFSEKSPPVTKVTVVNEEGIQTETQNVTGDDTTLILVVDDHPDVRNFVCSHLAEDYQFVEATDGEQGFACATETIPDLVISDVMMPKMDGFQFCERLKTDQRTSHIPVILLTARAGEENKISGLETGADDYLVKPFNPTELQVRVRNLIEQRRQLRARFVREGMLKLQEVAVTSADEAFLKKMMQTLEEHLEDEHFGVEKLSQSMNMGPRQLYRKVRALTGRAPVEFIRLVRLQRARELLEQKAGTVSEVAFQVGFSSLSYFSKSFKEEFGKLPSEISHGSE